MPSPVFAFKGKKTDSGVTNIRNVKSSGIFASLQILASRASFISSIATVFLGITD
jgi:hypothetical protein